MSKSVEMDADTVAVASPALRLLMIAAIATALLLQMAYAMMTSSNSEAVTFDEPAHIAAAVAYLHDRDLSWNVEHPPLIKILSGMSLRLAGVEVPRDSAEYRAGQQYGWGQQILFGSANEPRRTTLLARLPLIALTCLFGLGVFGFATDLVGAPGGLLALSFYTVTPDILGHGPLVTTDVGVSGFLMLTLWMLWRARFRSNRWMIGAGIAFGLALATKFTALVYAPVVAILCVVAAISPISHRLHLRRANQLRRSIVWPLGTGALAVAVVWMVYLAVDPALRYRLPIPELAANSTGPLAAIADVLPFPNPYRIGLRYVIGGEQINRLAFLNGQTYLGGRPSFYPVVLSMKTPAGLLAFWTLGLAAVVATRRKDIAIFVLMPAAFVLGLAMLSELNIGVRHVMPVVILLSVASGSAMAWRRPFVLPMALVCLIATAASSWAAHPRYFSYINALWGGPSRGYELVADSNIDWGQGLPYLAKYLDESGLKPDEVHLVYFGQGAPTAYGVQARDATATADFSDVQGVVIVSVTQYNFDRPRFSELGAPTGVVADTFLVFDRRSGIRGGR